MSVGSRFLLVNHLVYLSEGVLDDLSFLRYSKDVDGNAWSDVGVMGFGDGNFSPGSMSLLTL